MRLRESGRKQREQVHAVDRKGVERNSAQRRKLPGAWPAVLSLPNRDGDPPRHTKSAVDLHGPSLPRASNGRLHSDAHV